MFKGKRVGISIGILLAVFAICTAGLFYLKGKYTVTSVYVEGNVHYTEDEIKEMVMGGILGDNSLYLSFKYKNKGIEGVPFVDVMDVTILAPDTIKVTVYEKALTGYVGYLGACMYFDKDGYVVESSSVKTAGVPEIIGLKFDHIVVGEALPVENQTVFTNILNITKLLNKYNLLADKIYFGKSGEVVLYFGEVKVALGTDSVYLEDKLMILPGLLRDLEGKKGTLQMLSYDEENARYTFKPE